MPYATTLPTTVKEHSQSLETFNFYEVGHGIGVGKKEPFYFSKLADLQACCKAQHSNILDLLFILSCAAVY